MKIFGQIVTGANCLQMWEYEREDFSPLDWQSIDAVEYFPIGGCTNFGLFLVPGPSYITRDHWMWTTFDWGTP